MSAKALRNVDGETAMPTPNEDFPALEEKIYRAIEQLKAARAAKSVAERSAARLREQLDHRTEEINSLRTEAIALRKEREEVRIRVEKLLKQIDQMTVED
ncbi:MAG TPA: hypothetical protein VNW97_03325 [Candidatus Saccharimonadales bacterium]|jgi:chromosome segregation ATPase|nr:hypothetical protein [Candidatus Saccharimonadales bacterium]